MTTGLILKTLEIQNFKSFGEKKTVLSLEGLSGLTLFMGENEDALTPDSRNGCGKSSLLEGLAVVLTGKTIKKRKDTSGLVNKVNGKNCVLGLNFDFNEFECRIERGLKPGFLRLFKKAQGSEKPLDECNVTRSTIAETQAEIYSMLKLDIDLIRFILISATKTDNFFQLESADQKKIVETLFGFEALTVKAGIIKEQRQKAEVTLQIENSRIQEREIAQRRFIKQLEDVQVLFSEWTRNNENTVNNLAKEAEKLIEIDFDSEEQILKTVQDLNSQATELRTKNAIVSEKLLGSKAELERNQKLITATKQWLEDFDPKVVTLFLSSFDEYEESQSAVSELKQQVALIAQTSKVANQRTTEIDNELHSITDNCPTCKQSWPDAEARQNKISALKAELKEHLDKVEANAVEHKALAADIMLLMSVPKPSHPLFLTKDAAKRAQFEAETKADRLNELEVTQLQLSTQVDELQNTVDDLIIQGSAISEQSVTLLGTSKFSNMSELERSRDRLNALTKQIEDAEAAKNPHLGTLENLKAETLDDINTTLRDSLEDDIKHYQYLEKLLTRKDSPIRRLVISKWLPKLNELMNHYLSASELPYVIEFNDDLTATIKDFEMEMDFVDLSSGEEERVSLAMTWAFRDVFESINYPINFIGIDERLDAGLDGAGGEASINILREMAVNRHRNTFLVSHRKELVDAVDNIMMVKKKGRFSRLERLI